MLAKDAEMGPACKCSDRLYLRRVIRLIMLERIQHISGTSSEVAHFFRKSFDEELVANASQAIHSCIQELDVIPA
jgi:hypothetical protein